MPIWFLPDFKNTIKHQTTFCDDKIHIINVVWWYPHPTNKSYICFGSKIGRRRNTLRYSVRSWRLLQPANKVWGKVIFLHLFVILFTGGVWYPNMPSSRGVCSWGGAWWRPPRQLLLWAVRILLECILVFHFLSLLWTCKADEISSFRN